MSMIDMLNPYAWIMQFRRSMYRTGILRSHRIGIPVISIGNLSSGGTGKTPIVLWLAHYLRSECHKSVAVVLRGYKRNTSGLLVVSDGKAINAMTSQSGDEAQLYAQERYIVICDEDRVRGSLKAKELGANVILLDDAFQHRRIKRDLDIVIINALEGIPHVIPFGNGREEASALADAGLVIVTNATSNVANLMSEIRRNTSAPVLSANIAFERFELLHSAEASIDLSHATVLALSGIGKPEGFENLLASKVAKVVPFRLRDHVVYDNPQVDEVIAFASKNNCSAVVTTTKDAVKLRDLQFRTTIPFIVMHSRPEFSNDDITLFITQLRNTLQRS